MRTETRSDNWIVDVGYEVARVTTVVLFLFAVAVATSQNDLVLGLPTLAVLQPSAILLSYGVMWLGLAVSWHWKIPGSLMILGGFAAYMLLHRSSPDHPLGWTLFLFPLVGLMYTFCWWQKGR